jgi:hypothetical protein
MLHVLVITLADDPETLFGISEDVLPKLYQRAAVRESRTVEDAFEHIETKWPNVILAQSNLVMRSEERSVELLKELVDQTRKGCITIFLGYFFHVLSKVDQKRLEAIFADLFRLKWKLVKSENVITDLVTHNPNMLGTTILPLTIQTQALFLEDVSKEEAVYRARQQPELSKL